MQETRVNLAYEESTNDYGEKVKKIKGLISSTGYEETRENSFVLRKRGSVFPWSPVNNCTTSASEASMLGRVDFSPDEIALLSQGCRISKGGGVAYRLLDNQLSWESISKF